MPLFCRHNRFEANCPICKSPEPDPAARRAPRSGSSSRSRSGGGTSNRSTAMRVRQAPRAAEDGYRNPLVPGLRSSADAARLADEMAFSAARLAALASDPPGLYAEVAAEGDPEEATWLAFLIAYLGPLEGADPWAGVRAARVPGSTGELTALEDVPLGPRTSHDPERGSATVSAYRAWVARAGSQAASFSGEAGWTPERRFSRVFERLALPGLSRSARFDLLVTLGRLGRYELRAESLHLSGAASDPVITAAKRVFGIADPLLLDRRAGDLAREAEVPLDALDLALWNWQEPERRSTGGVRHLATRSGAAHEALAVAAPPQS